MKTQLTVLSFLFSLQGCVVPTSRYDQAVRDAATVRAQNEALRHSADLRIGELTKEAQAAKHTLEARESSLSECQTERHNVRTRMDEAAAIQKQLQGELQRVGKDARTLLVEKGVLQRALDDARARLTELRRNPEASGDRATRASTDLARVLRPQVEAKQLEVVIRDGEPIVILLAQDLFDGGRADLRPATSALLATVAQTLSASPGWTFRISAYTSSRTPPARFRSPLQLSLARAQAVALKLISLGVASKVLSVAGAGDAYSPGAEAGGDMRDRVELRVTGRTVGAAGRTH